MLMKSEAFSSTPKIGPLAFTAGFRLSLATASWKYRRSSAQSHCVMTKLRSIPCGRGGASCGYSPPLIRSVQYA
jgi:hypothetical protein